MFFSRSRDALIHVYDEAGSVIEMHAQAGQFKNRSPRAINAVVLARFVAAVLARFVAASSPSVFVPRLF